MTWTLAVKGTQPGNEKDNDDASCHYSQPDMPANIHNVPRKPSAALGSATPQRLPGILIRDRIPHLTLSSLLTVWEPNPLFPYIERILPQGTSQVQSFLLTRWWFSLHCSISWH
jgi:hypothetical protein